MADINSKVDGVVDGLSDKTGLDKDTLKKGGIAVVAVIVILLVVAMLSNMSGAYMNPYNARAKAINKNDAKKYTKTISKDVLSYLEDKNDWKDYEDEYDSRIDSYVDSLEDTYGDDIKISYKCIGKVKYTKDELDDLQDRLEDSDKDFDFKVKAAYRLAIKIKVKGDDKKKVYFTTDTVAKVDGKWMFVDELY